MDAATFKSLFTFRGRISRKTFMLHCLCPLLLVFLSLFFPLLMMQPSFILGEETLGIIEFIVLIFLMAIMVSMIWIPLAATCKRLHDLGYSGWWQLLTFIPFIGFFIWIAMTCLCIFKKGQNTPNVYGEPQEDLNAKA